MANGRVLVIPLEDDEDPFIAFITKQQVEHEIYDDHFIGEATPRKSIANVRKTLELIYQHEGISEELVYAAREILRAAHATQILKGTR